MIDRATVQRIKDAADIVEVVGDYVSLTRRGANYMGLCPFHNERTPSFSVNKARNFCYCFSCHKGGSPVNFIMEKEGISYHEALLQLAKKYGIKVEEKELTDEERELMSRRESMFIANEWSMNYFEKTLHEDEEGRNIGLQYVYGRGLTPEAIKNFHIGYSLDNFSSFTSEAEKKGFDVELLRTLGLTGVAQNGNHYDKFRGRVIFPIQNSSGKVIAFGGRDLKGGPMKYINSPESEIYKKSNELYGIFQAKNTIAKEDRCYLVEGYLDVISMWQSGIKNVVASSGTALTDGQIALIHRFTNNVTLIYDGDSAGIKAALRGIDMLLSHQLDLKVLLLPDGDDPDSLSRKLSAEEFRNFIQNNQTDVIKFKTKILADESGNDTQKRLEAIRSVVTTLAHIPDKIKRDIYVQECSRILNINENSIIGDIAKLRERILQNERINRRQNDLNNFISKENNTLEKENKIVQDQQDLIKDKSFINNPLRPLEWTLLEYCLKYGFLKLWESETESGDVVEVTTFQYVSEELELDGITFSVEDFSRIFKIIKELLPKFKEEKEVFMKELEKQAQEQRKRRMDEIAEKGMSMSEIERQELKIEEEINLWFRNEINEFSKNYSVREFASHEDPVVRKYANLAFSQKHQLSNIYKREGNKIETEEDKLIYLVLNAINILKNGILDIELKKLLSRLRELPAEESEEIQKVNSRISYILQTRSKMAKDIGDRIISPHK